MQACGEERAVRAAVLRHLLASNEWPVDARGARLRGVRIIGYLNLDGATPRCPLSLDKCYVDAAEPAFLDQATALRVVLTRCQLAGLTGEMLSAREVDLSGSTLTGPLRLPSSNIAGQLCCRGARLTGRGMDAPALVADGMRVGGSVFLDEGFTAVGAVRLSGADITGQLSCSGARLTGRDSDGGALAADGMKTAGDVFLDQGFTAAGTIGLRSAHVGGSVALRPAALAGPNEVALDAADAQITGSLLWAPDGQVFGQVNLEGATVGQLVDEWSSGRPNGFWPAGGPLR